MRRLPLVTSLLTFGSGALLLYLWSLGLKWGAIFLLAWFAVLGIGLLRSFHVHVEKLLVYTMVLANSIRMDVHVVYVPGGEGFPIGLGDVCWLVLMFLWWRRVRRTGEKTEWPLRFQVPFLLLILAGIIGSVPNPEISAGSRGVMFVIQSWLLFFYLYNAKFEDADYYKLAVGIGVALTIQGVIGALQGATHSSLGLEFFGATNAAINTLTSTEFSRVGGTIGQPNRFAMFVNAVIFVPIAMILASRSKIMKVLYALVFCFSFAALVMSQSRGAWMGFFAGFVPFAYLALREKMNRTLAAFTVAWILITGVVLVIAIPETRERLMAPDQNSAYSRIPMALTALRMIRYNPFGVGIGMYIYRMNAYDVTEYGLTYSFRFPVHNAYLLLCAEQGIWALITYLVLFVVYYVEVFKLVFYAKPGWPRIIGLAFGAGMVAVHLHMNLEITYLMSDDHQWFSMGMVLMVLRHLQRRDAVPALAPAAPAVIEAGRGGVAAAVP